MTHSPEEIRKQIRGYWIVGATLYVFTIITVLATRMESSIPIAIATALIIASIKGTLVSLFFMHLISEKQMIYWALALTTVFFVVLMALPVSQYLDVWTGVMFK